MPPFQVTRAASKYIPVVLPLVEGVMNTTPPPGPTIPITHVPPLMHVFVAVVKLDDVTEVNVAGEVDVKVNV